MPASVVLWFGATPESMADGMIRDPTVMISPITVTTRAIPNNLPYPRDPLLLPLPLLPLISNHHDHATRYFAPAAIPAPTVANPPNRTSTINALVEFPVHDVDPAGAIQ